MPLNIRDDRVNQLATKLAARKHLNKTDAVKLALENELSRADEAVPLWGRLKPLLDKVATYPDTGLAADKAYFDDLSGDY